MAVMTQFVGEAFNKMLLHAMKVHAVLRSLWPSEGRKDHIKIEFQNSRVGFFLCILTVPHSLCFGICFNAGNSVVLTSSEAQIVKGALINGEESACCSIFRSHVGNGCSVCKSEFLHACTKEFNEFSNNAVFSQHFNDAQRHVSCSDAWLKASSKADAHNVRCQHVDRLAKHDCLGFNSTNPPSKNAKSVDHSRVGVGPNQRVSKPYAIFLASNACEEFEINLVYNSS